MSDGNVAANRRARARRQMAGNLTTAEKAEKADREGRQMGAKLAAREKALGIVQTADALAADGVALTADAAEEVAEAREVLASADAAARNVESSHLTGDRRGSRGVGRWVPTNQRAMTGRDLMSAAKVAALTAARQMARAGMPRLEDAELADLESDLVAVALERGAARGRRDSLPHWRDLEAADGDYRGAWRSFLTAHARTYARDRVNAYKAAEAAAKAERDSHTPDDRRRARSAEKAAEAGAMADQIAERLHLTAAERDGVVAVLDGLTHRERGELLGITPEAAKQRTKNALRKLRARFPNEITATREIALAQAAAAKAEALAHPLTDDARQALAEARSERAALDLMAHPREDHGHVPYGWHVAHGWRGLGRKVPPPAPVAIRETAATPA